MDMEKKGKNAKRTKQTKERKKIIHAINFFVL